MPLVITSLGGRSRHIDTYTYTYVIDKSIPKNQLTYTTCSMI